MFWGAERSLPSTQKSSFLRSSFKKLTYLAVVEGRLESAEVVDTIEVRLQFKVVVNPRTWSLSAKVRNEVRFSWDTLTSPTYMKLISSFKSSALTSHIIITGSDLLTRPPLDRNIWRNIPELAERTIRWALIAWPSHSKLTSKRSPKIEIKIGYSIFMFINI